MIRGKKGYGSAAYMQNFAPTSVWGFSNDASKHGFQNLTDLGVKAVKGAAKASGAEGPLLEASGGEYWDSLQNKLNEAMGEKFEKFEKFGIK